MVNGEGLHLSISLFTPRPPGYLGKSERPLCMHTSHLGDENFEVARSIARSLVATEGSADRTRGRSPRRRKLSHFRAGCLFGLEKGGDGRNARRAGERRCLWRSAEADRIRWLPSPLPCTG